jgi:hypothetical protein
MYSQRSPVEQATLRSVSDIARAMAAGGGSLFAAGYPAYSSAMGYLTTLLGGSKAAAARAIGPQAGNISDIYGGAERSLEAGPLRGGALETAEADLARRKVGDIANLIPQAQQAGLGLASTAGLAGAQAGEQAAAAAGGLQEQVTSLEQANRQFGISAEQANRFGAAGISTQNRALDIQAILGDRGLSIQENLGRGSLALQQQQIDYSHWYQQQIIQIAQEQIKLQRSQQEGQKYGGLLGTLLKLFGGGSGNTQGDNTSLLPPGFQWPGGDVNNPNTPGYPYPTAGG